MGDALGFFKLGIAFCQISLAALDVVVKPLELLSGAIERSGQICELIISTQLNLTAKFTARQCLRPCIQLCKGSADSACGVPSKHCGHKQDHQRRYGKYQVKLAPRPLN